MRHTTLQAYTALVKAFGASAEPFIMDLLPAVLDRLGDKVSVHARAHTYTNARCIYLHACTHVQAHSQMHLHAHKHAPTWSYCIQAHAGTHSDALILSSLLLQ